MASTTTYGDFPGVKVTTAGGAITGVAVGREQKFILVGEGDASAGDASVNDATQIESRARADTKFGDGTELAEAMKDALANGANIDFLYGVMVDETSVSGETFSGTSSGTLANAPIVEDTSVITVTDTVESTDADVEFRYDSPPSAPSNSNTVYINPITAEWSGDESSDYSFDYDYQDWSSAYDEAESVIGTEESAVIGVLTESEDEATNVSGNVNSLRGDYKMAMGLSAAEPNDNDSESPPNAKYDTGNYTDSIDNDAYFLHAPARKEGSQHLITGALGGLMAGNDLDDSIYGDSLTVDDLEQRFTQSESDDIRDEDVIPVVQPPTGGSITVDDNVSTSTETDWVRDYWRRRIVDQVILIAKTVGESVIGRINDERTRDTVQTQLEVELRGLVEDRLLEPNTSDETNWFVDVYEIDSDTVGIDIGVTPLGIAKRIDTSITINT